MPRRSWLSQRQAHRTVTVPDVVRFELAQRIGERGAQETLAWIRANEPDRLFVATTEALDELLILLLERHGGVQAKGRSEIAAAELLARRLARGNEEVVLLFGDDARTDNFLVPLPRSVRVASPAEYRLLPQSS